jgi:uncharacterized membrane protein YbhN (UPF0104 family)
MAGQHHRGSGAVQTRKSWRPSGRVLATAILGAVSIGLLLWVAPPAKVVDQIGDMNPAWVLAAVALEVGSCLSYVIVFRRFFPEPPRAVSHRVAWIAMGAGAVLPGGNISSAAARALRRAAVPAHGLRLRCERRGRRAPALRRARWSA